MVVYCIYTHNRVTSWCFYRAPFHHFAVFSLWLVGFKSHQLRLTCSPIASLNAPRYNNLNEQYKAKVEEGLSKFLAFLRDEQERERLEEIERLKPIGTQVGSYLEYRLKIHAAMEATDGKGAKGPRTSTERAWIRQGHAAVQVSGRG